MIVSVFFNFYTPHNYDNASITFTSLWPTPLLHACQHVRGRSPHRIKFLWLFGGRSSRRSLAAALDQSACNGWGDRRSANQIPRQGEGGPRDVTTPPGQSTDLPLVLASDRVTSDSAHQNGPVRESGEGGGVNKGCGHRFLCVRVCVFVAPV